MHRAKHPCDHDATPDPMRSKRYHGWQHNHKTIEILPVHHHFPDEHRAKQVVDLLRNLLFRLPRELRDLGLARVQRLLEIAWIGDINLQGLLEFGDLFKRGALLLGHLVDRIQDILGQPEEQVLRACEGLEHLLHSHVELLQQFGTDRCRASIQSESEAHTARDSCRNRRDGRTKPCERCSHDEGQRRDRCEEGRLELAHEIREVLLGLLETTLRPKCEGRDVSLHLFDAPLGFCFEQPFTASEPRNARATNLHVRQVLHLRRLRQSGKGSTSRAANNNLGFQARRADARQREVYLGNNTRYQSANLCLRCIEFGDEVIEVQRLIGLGLTGIAAKKRR
mmetsp:Transcript_72050/g.234187  ORF Transcript_72050/g.234187 Transcript_72050/m.234187 type:complete len:338 (-) Transcript_72050:101-1114(-)